MVKTVNCVVCKKIITSILLDKRNKMYFSEAVLKYTGGTAGEVTLGEMQYRHTQITVS